MIDENTLGVWLLQVEEPGTCCEGNWTGTLRRDKSGVLYLAYELRWYVDDKVFDSADKRSRSAVTQPDWTTDGQAIASVRKLVARLRREMYRGGDDWELLRGKRTFPQFVKAFRRMPGVHLKPVTVQ